jgi:hypothetical protein
MDAHNIDMAIETVAYLSMIMGLPAGPVAADANERRWLWSEEENDTPSVSLILTETDFHVELDLDEAEPGHPRYYTLIGWCAIHRVICVVILGGHRMRVNVTSDKGDPLHAH